MHINVKICFRNEFEKLYLRVTAVDAEASGRDNWFRVKVAGVGKPRSSVTESRELEAATLEGSGLCCCAMVQEKSNGHISLGAFESNYNIRSRYNI